MRVKYRKHLQNDSQLCGSSMWKKMMKVKSVAEHNTAWIIGQGNINFWKEKWLDEGIIADIISPPTQLAALSVKQVILNENGAFDQCQGIIPNDVILKIKD